MSTAMTFTRRVGRDARKWTAIWAMLIAAVMCGWVTGHLSLASMIVIGVFVIWQGLLPYGRFVRPLAGDIAACSEEKQIIQQLTQEKLDQLRSLNAPGSGSLLRLLQAMLQQQDPRRRQAALHQFLLVARRRWEALLEPVETAAGMAPMLGLGGSLIGMVDALRHLANVGLQDGPGSLIEAMVTMASTTMAGCIGALLLIGLVELGRTALNTHLAELEMWGGQLLDQPLEDDDLYQLFDTPSGG